MEASAQQPPNHHQPPAPSDGRPEQLQKQQLSLTFSNRRDESFAAWRARLSARLSALEPGQDPIVLVACGSFNPPTRAHLRLFSAGAAVAVKGARPTGDRHSAAATPPRPTGRSVVVGGLLSPVGDGYGKAGLAPSAHRLAMCALAAAAAPGPSSVDVCVHGWEASREGGRVHTRTLDVLRHIERELNELVGGCREGEEDEGEAAAKAAATRATPPPVVRVMLLGGTDLVESMRRPGLWSEPDALLREHGVVCVDRPGEAVGTAAPPAGAARAGEAAASAVDEALLASRVLHAEGGEEEGMVGVSSSRAREALRAALFEAEAQAEAKGAGGEDKAATSLSLASADPRVAALLHRSVAEYAVLHGLY